MPPRTKDWYIVDAESGTILRASNCYLLQDSDFPDNAIFAEMSDDEVSYYATEHGQTLSLPANQ